MALLDTYMFKPRPDQPWMTPAEKLMFQKLRRGGALSMFRCTQCEKCGVEIPKPKRFCSERCFTIWSVANRVVDALLDNGENE